MRVSPPDIHGPRHRTAPVSSSVSDFTSLARCVLVLYSHNTRSAVLASPRMDSASHPPQYVRRSLESHLKTRPGTGNVGTGIGIVQWEWPGESSILTIGRFRGEKPAGASRAPWAASLCGPQVRQPPTTKTRSRDQLHCHAAKRNSSPLGYILRCYLCSGERKPPSPSRGLSVSICHVGATLSLSLATP